MVRLLECSGHNADGASRCCTAASAGAVHLSANYLELTGKTCVALSVDWDAASALLLEVTLPADGPHISSPSHLDLMVLEEGQSPLTQPHLRSPPHSWHWDDYLAGEALGPAPALSPQDLEVLDVHTPGTHNPAGRTVGAAGPAAAATAATAAAAAAAAEPSGPARAVLQGGGGGGAGGVGGGCVGARSAVGARVGPVGRGCNAGSAPVGAGMDHGVSAAGGGGQDGGGGGGGGGGSGGGGCGGPAGAGDAVTAGGGDAGQAAVCVSPGSGAAAAALEAAWLQTADPGPGVSRRVRVRVRSARDQPSHRALLPQPPLPQPPLPQPPLPQPPLPQPPLPQPPPVAGPVAGHASGGARPVAVGRPGPAPPPARYTPAGWRAPATVTLPRGTIFYCATFPPKGRLARTRTSGGHRGVSVSRIRDGGRETWPTHLHA
ncbi:MAG: hypothetical protein WDW38_011174 [Sanguina aurantia]